MAIFGRVHLSADASKCRAVSCRWKYTPRAFRNISGGLCSRAVLVAWWVPKVGMLHAVKEGHHGLDVEHALLSPPTSAPEGPFPGNNPQACFGSAASLAHSNSRALMGYCFHISQASKRVHARWNENAHSTQLGSQAKTPPPHRGRAQSQVLRQ